MAIHAKFEKTIISVGDQIKVSQKIIEGGKERTSIFEGIVIAIRGEGENKSFTVRRIATGAIGVERIWPLNSPWIKKIEVLKKGKVRRAKLYYLRKRVGKGAVKVKTKEIKKPRDEKKKPRQPRRKSRPKTSEK